MSTELLEPPTSVSPATQLEIDRSRGDFVYPESHEFDAGVGITHATIDYIADVKNEPDWIREFRHKALDVFLAKPMPTSWASKDLENIVFENIRYYLANAKRPTRSWEEVPDDVKKTFERLGIPEQERKFLAGVEAQFDSEAVYSNIKAAVADQGVIFTGSTEGLIKHPELFKKWFGKVIPTGDNKFSALNSAVFSGGSFIYIPPGVKVKHPLQAYFRINAENFGQFERTLIIADEGSEVMYMEGCTAPKFETATLHSAVVELVAMKGAKIQYVTVQNWSNNVFNLVTKRAIAHEEAEVKWIDCNIGSRLTMKYPGVVLKGRKARGEVISIALAGDGQHQDTGAKMIHAADETTSNIVSKSISLGSGRATYRGLVHVPKHLKGCKNNTECDALLINPTSRTDTYPEQIFYMMSRGLTEAQAMSLSVNGFVNDLVRQFPMEYSVELKRLIDLEMEGSVG
jgi:Fe-S cluster assembly protein SufB